LNSMKVLTSLLFIVFSIHVLYAQDECVAAISLDSQAEVDSFKHNYPDCVDLDRVFVRGEDITNLNGLSHIESIGNYFSISNTSLKDLRDISNLYVITDEFHINNNPKLETLDGLRLFSAFQQFSITGNDLLTDISVLEDIDHVDFDLHIANNPLLEVCCVVEDIVNSSRYDGPDLYLSNNAVGCNNLAEISCCCSSNCECTVQNVCGNIYLESQSDVDNFSEEYVACSYVDTLFIQGEGITNVDGLSSFNSISGDFVVVIENTSLSDLDNLDDLRYSEISSLIIQENSSLSDCCELFDDDNDDLRHPEVLISNNDVGCNDAEEITLTCNCETAYLSSQDDVDNFNVDYAGCTSIKNLYIDGSDITDLEGLAQIEEVTSYLLVQKSQLQDLKGIADIKLENTNRIEIKSNPMLASLSGMVLPSSYSELFLLINESLVDLSALEAITEFERLILTKLPIQDLESLQNLKYVQSLSLNSLNNLSDLDGLSSVAQIHRLSIVGNENLTNIEGIEGVKDLDQLSIESNLSLSDCCALKQLLESNAISAWKLNIENNDTGCNNLTQAIRGCNSDNYCFDINLTSQDRVDNFSNNNPGCTIVENLYVSDSSIINLDGLSAITRIEGDLRINETSLVNLEGLSGIALENIRNVTVSDNHALESLNGINFPETFVKLLLIRNPSLSDITSLSTVKELDNLSFYINHAVTNLNGLEDIEFIHKSIEIVDSPLLEEISQFSKVTRTDDIRINHNTALQSIDGFNNLISIDQLYVGWNGIVHLDGFGSLKEINDYMQIKKNPELVDITAFENLDTVGTIDLGGNLKLSDCCVFKQHLELGTREFISANGEGCLDKQEVIDTCPRENITSTTDSEIARYSYTITPNPFDNEITIKHQGNMLAAIIKIYDINGALVTTYNMDTPERSLDTSSLKSGIYIVSIQNSSGVFIDKLVKRMFEDLFAMISYPKHIDSYDGL